MKIETVNYKATGNKLLGSTQMPRPLIQKDETKEKWMNSMEFNKKGHRVKKLE